MKKIILLLSLLISVLFVEAQFGPQKDISKSTIPSDIIKSFDLDGDGDLDLLSLSEFDNKIVWYKNLNNGNFSSEITITSNVVTPKSIDAGDIDGDGDLDIVSASRNDNKIAWYENLGNGSFGTQQIISIGANQPSSVYIQDLDNDGDADIISTSTGDNKIAWYENLGNGSFGVQQIISTANGFPISVYAADLDNDGDADIISAYQVGEIVWHENLGNGSFGTRQIISVAVNQPTSVYTTDVDNDGNIDILSSSFQDDKIAWYKNLGNNTFGSQQIISINVDGANSVYAEDLDNDGDIDVLSAGYIDGEVSWFENLGSGNFSSKNVIFNSVQFLSTRFVYSGDLDGDGNIDIISGSLKDPKVAWYKNLGNASFSSAQDITTLSPIGLNSIFSVDLDQDGNIDVLSASMRDNKIAWYRNLGNGSFGTQQIISTGNNFSTSHATSVYAADLDSDGDFDVISTYIHGDNIIWFENLGNGTFGNGQVISSNSIGAKSVYAKDLNNDGDLDIISGSNPGNSTGKVIWFENLGNGTFGLEQIITTGLGNAGAESIYIEDLNNDGKLDILIAINDKSSLSNDKIVWCENLGNGTFGNQQIITTAVSGAASVYAEDLNNDGDLDVLSASMWDDKLVWYENLGSGIFGNQQIISFLVDGPNLVYAFDLNRDGNIDIISGSRFDNKIAWYKNIGNASFGNQQIISTSINEIKSIHVNDIDGDGDPDLFSASSGNNKVAWYENNLICSFNQTNIAICQGDSIIIYGFVQNITGIYYDTLQAVAGCDSILSTILTVNSFFTSSQSTSICQGDSILLGGSFQNTAGIYYDSLQTISGCDSILATTLTLNPTLFSSQSISICQGDSILIYGSFQNVTSIYYDSLQTINGCDSILTTALTVTLPPKLHWANSMGSTGNDVGHSISVDLFGNVYTVGRFQGTADFDPGIGVSNLTSFGSTDIFIQKLDPSGNLIWAKSIGGNNPDYSFSMTVDSSGYVYVVGSFVGTVDFNPGAGVNNLTSNGQSDIYILKLDASGNFIWAKSIGNNFSQYGAVSISVDGLGYIYIGGFHSGITDFDPGTGTTNISSFGNFDIFILKLDSGGNFIWVKSIGSVDDDRGYSFTINSFGDIYITGHFKGTVDFDPGIGVSNLTSNGNMDIFIQKLDSAGNFVWAKSMGSASRDRGYSISIDSFGNIYTVGTFVNTVDFDPGIGVSNLTSPGIETMFIQKLNSSGNFIWAKSVNGAFLGPFVITGERSISVDLSGNVYTIGYFENTVDFDPGTGISNLTSNGNFDIFIQKLDTDGDFIWAKSMGAAGDDRGYSISVDLFDRIYTTGFFENTVDFNLRTGITNLTSNGNVDIFVQKLIQCNNFTTSSIIEVACDTYTVPSNNETYTVSGIYMDTIPNSRGCDSIITIDLTIKNSSSATDIQMTCGLFTWINGVTYASSNNTATYTLINSLGCDSIVSLNLIINPIYQTNQNQSICQGDSLQIYGVFQNSVGIYYDSLQTISGCDSILSTTLTVNPLPTVTIANFSPDTICSNGSAIALPNGTPLGGNYSGIGVSSGNFDPAIAGIGVHNVIYTFTDASSCINSDTTIINVMLCTAVDEISQFTNIIIYPNPNTGKFTIEKPVNFNKEVNVKLLDAASKLIIEKIIPIGKQKTEIDITNYSKGIYFLQLIIDNEAFVKQIVKN